MRKMTALILATVMLCTGIAGCAAQHNDPEAESTAATQSTATTPPAADSVTVPTVNDNVASPDEMPEKPENDYSLPPDEKPGDRADVIDR